MGLGMSYLPLFPQPLPLFLAFLIAFVVYQRPRIGMPAGGLVIGLGLMYNLAELKFISFLGETSVRVAFIVAWMALFVIVPVLFNRYRAALAVDFGILAAVSLFFAPLYFLAIPILLASAVYFKKFVSFSVIYYVLLTVPLQIMQYYQDVVSQITRSDWWVEAGSSPPVFISLTHIADQLNLSMSQFRLYDMSQVFNDIAGQTTWVPDWQGRTIGDAVTQYRDSIPGILMFVIIIIGLALALMFFTRMLVKEGLIGSGDKLFPCFTATIAAALFFILMGSLQVPLAFTADVSPVTMILGIFGTLLLTFPVAFMDYSPKRRASNKEITDKAQLLLDKVLGFERQIANVKDNIPVDVSVPEGKLSVLHDQIKDIMFDAERRAYEQEELDHKFQELDKLGAEKEAIEVELNKLLSEYHIFVTCQFSDWAGRLKASGFPVKTALNGTYQKEMPLEERVQAIKQVIESGRTLTNEVIAVADPIYSIIKPLYDHSLPEKNRSIEFAQEKLATNESPWIAVEGLYNALNNWKRQYGKDIQSTMKYLNNSIAPIANLTFQREVLPSVFGENTPKVIGYIQRAQDMKVNTQGRFEKQELDLLDVIALKEDLEGYIGMASDILTTLYVELINNEETIERLLPTKDYMWEKNANLRARLKYTTEVLADPSKFEINEIMEKLPKYLDYIDECVQTLAAYSERKEFLLNYPLAETAIEEQLKQKQRLTPQDLPFQPRFGAEYLRLYYSARFGEYMYDKENFELTKRP